MLTNGVTRIFATLLAGIARERVDGGEPLLSFMEAEAGYLAAEMPGTASAMSTACRDARSLRDEIEAGAHQAAPAAGGTTGNTIR